MDYQREAHEQYQRAYANALRNQLKDKKQRVSAYPAVLEALLNEDVDSCRVDLGVMDIPTNLIIGTAEYSDLLQMYTKDFFPLANPNSELASKWRRVYQAFVAEPNSSEIRCLEFLGKFYVVEGLLDVSVAKVYGTCTVRSHVVRVLPKYTECKTVRRYYDFLVQFQLTNLYQLQFTQPGHFEKLQLALGKKDMQQWTDSDRNRFLKCWPKIERAFQTSFDNCLNITSADALVVLLDKYSFAQILQMDSWVLARIFQASWKDLNKLSHANEMEAEIQIAGLHSA